MDSNDKSLLRCTIRKSADVVKKLVKYAAYTIAVVIAGILSIYGAMGIWAVAEVAEDPIYKSIESITSFLSGIPWYYYAGAIVIAAIPVYSFLWCVARELTEEDWESKEAENFVALAFALALFPLALAFAFALTLTLALFALAFVALVAFVALALFALTLTRADSKAFLFVGAYLHYRKRVKAE